MLILIVITLAADNNLDNNNDELKFFPILDEKGFARKNRKNDEKNERRN